MVQEIGLLRLITNAHTNANQGLEGCTAIDQQVLVPNYLASLEDCNDCGATYLRHRGISKETTGFF